MYKAKELSIRSLLLLLKHVNSFHKQVKIIRSSYLTRLDLQHLSWLDVKEEEEEMLKMCVLTFSEPQRSKAFVLVN